MGTLYDEYLVALERFKEAVAAVEEAIKDKSSHNRLSSISSVADYEKWLSSNREQKQQEIIRQQVIKEKIAAYKVRYKELLEFLPITTYIEIPGEENITRGKSHINIGGNCYSLRHECET